MRFPTTSILGVQRQLNQPRAPFLSAKGKPICHHDEWQIIYSAPPPHAFFVGLMPQRTSTKAQQPRAKKGPFSSQQKLFSDQPPSCWDVSQAPWCPSINLGELPGQQPSWQPAPLSPSLHIPPSISSLSWIPYEAVFSVDSSHKLPSPGLPWQL